MSVLRMATAVAAVLLSTTACSSDSDAPSSDPTTTASPSLAAFDDPVIGLPEGVAENSAGTPGAGLSDDGQLWVVTYGSSTNPLAVEEVSAEGQTITVSLTQNDGPATMDLVPATSTLALPDDVDPEQPISVVLPEFGTIALDPPTPGTIVWLPAA